MTEAERTRVTRILLRADAEEPPDLEEVLPLLYDQLRELAAGYLRRERAAHTLQPTALVHEAYVRLVDQSQVPWNDAVHFRAIAARAMRQVLIDHARKRGTAKRGGDRLRVTLDDAVAVASRRELDVLALDEIMGQLAAVDERKARVVELLFFGGLTHAEAARVVGVSQKTVEADWYMARAWLGARLKESDS